MKTILIVDDRADNRAVLIAMLVHRGYRLLEANSGEQALKIARNEKPDLIIADVLMPKMDGYEFVQQLRADPKIAHINVIFYTASYIEEESRKLAKACGVHHIIVKPAEPEEVFKIVDRALGERLKPAASVPAQEFEREHLHLVTDKLADKVEELEKAAERLGEQADIINQARDAIIIQNFTDQRVTFWNAGAERVYGWSANEAIGRPIGELIVADPGELKMYTKIIGSTGEFHGEVKQRAKDRKEVIVEGRATLISNPDGTPRSVLLINTDITEQKNLETQLLRTQRLESIGMLAGGVAHDLNNILGPILMCAESLHGNVKPEDAGLMISLIEDSARRGCGILKQVLTFARGVEGERVIINPRHLIDEMVDIARNTFPKSIEVIGQYPEAPWSINGDPTQLHQVLLNLSINARDAMANGGSLILQLENFDIDEHYASMTPGAKPGPHAVLSVSDTGTGMSLATIDKIFDPFFTTKELGKGTGLGLSTSLGIVKSHGGFISVYSEQGRGTTFKVFLPALEAETASQKIKAPSGLLEGNGELILVVDDETNIRRATKMILEKHNYRMMEASDGPEALAIFAQEMNSVSLVLTDMSMPYMDGIALTRALKKMKADVSIIASIGQGNQAGVAELQSIGVKNFLAKPYNTEKLLVTVDETLKHRESELPGV